MPKYKGHKNWNHWNVSYWINNNDSLYELAKKCLAYSSNKEEAAKRMLFELPAYCCSPVAHDAFMTPDGAPYSVSSIRAAMRGWEKN
jgi:hypothetical protein